MVTIRTTQLSKRYQHHYAVDNLSFEITAGEIVGFLGPNGAGKTTTFRMLAGLITPTAGTVEIFGAPAPARGPKRLGAMIEEPTFYPYLTGYQNLRVAAYLTGTHEKSELNALLQQVKLEHAKHKRVSQYSQGMRQRLGLARALLSTPGVLLLDEPTNGLDPKGIAEIRELIRNIASTGVTVLISSHILAELEKLVDRVIAIDAGKMVFDGPLTGIMANTEETVRYVLHAVSEDDLTAALQGLGYTPERTARGTEVHVPAAEADQLLSALVHRGVMITAATRTTLSLEEAYLALVKSDGPA